MIQKIIYTIILALRALGCLCVLMILSACQSKDPKQRPLCLDEMPRDLVSSVEEFYGDKQWLQVKNVPFDAYVVIRGSVQDDHTVKLASVIESVNGESREFQARKYAEGVRISPITVGGRIRPRAEVYVFFYETALQPSQALVVARQTGIPAAAASTGGNLYLKIITY